MAQDFRLGTVLELHVLDVAKCSHLAYAPVVEAACRGPHLLP